MSVLLLGFLIGLKHALEADHVAAVATLVNRRSSLRETAQVGLVWGFGHSLTLFVTGTAVVVLDATVPERFAHLLELAVGVMLIGLGLDVLRRLIRDRVHYHVHRHSDGIVHFHAHSHRADVDHERHEHAHPTGLRRRALAVGLLHGLAGSAALIVLTLASIDSLMLALAYMALFGVGSIIGMAALSVVIAIPFRVAGSHLTWANNGLQAVLGLATIGLGGYIVHDLSAVI